MSNKELENYVNAVLEDLHKAEAYDSDNDYLFDTPVNLFSGVTIA